MPNTEFSVSITNTGTPFRFSSSAALRARDQGFPSRVSKLALPSVSITRIPVSSGFFRFSASRTFRAFRIPMARGVFPLAFSSSMGLAAKSTLLVKGRISSAFRFPKTTIPARSLSLYARRRMESTALFAKESLSFAPWERLASTRNKTDTLFFLRKRFSRRSHALISRSSPPILPLSSAARTDAGRSTSPARKISS